MAAAKLMLGKSAGSFNSPFLLASVEGDISHVLYALVFQMRCEKLNFSMYYSISMELLQVPVLKSIPVQSGNCVLD